MLEDIPKQGKKFTIKEVRPGYARNFLLPQKMVQAATPAALKALQARIAHREKKQEEKKKEYQKLAEKLQSLTLSLTLKMGEKGQAFGSVSQADILNALKENGISVEKSWIALENQIKTTGEKAVPIIFPYGIRAEARIVVQAE